MSVVGRGVSGTRSVSRGATRSLHVRADVTRRGARRVARSQGGSVEDWIVDVDRLTTRQFHRRRTRGVGHFYTERYRFP